MIGLYVHIPFCIRKCNYCDFLSFPPTEELQQAYVAALQKEIKLYSRSGNYRLASLYLGGGTPTLLTATQLQSLFTEITRSFDLDASAEVTVEANPGTFSLEKAKLLKSLGVNRISLGVQSMHNDELKMMGRIHSSEDVIRSVDILNNSDFHNYSFDFIGGLPGQSSEKLLTTLQKAVDLKPRHLSLYGLKVEQGTAWECMHLKNELDLPDEDKTADMMKDCQEFLGAQAFNRYEISNYAISGYESKHNLRYWLNEEYLGLGLGASSYLNKERFTNEQSIEKYVKLTNKNVFPVVEREKIKVEIEQAETVILGLRLISGVDRENFRQRFHIDILDVFEKVIYKHVERGLLKLTSTHLSLTMRGFEVANEVMMDFLPE